MQFLTILATAVATAAATQGFIVLKDWWLLGREGRFALLYAAIFLERFADECSTMLGEKESFEASDGHDGTDHAGLPAMVVFPSEIDWRRVGIALTEEAFALRVDLAAAQEEIRFLYEMDPPDGGDLKVKTQTVRFGLRAIDLARRMRSQGGLPTASSAKRDYSAERYLLERRAHFDEVQRTALAAQERSRRELAALSAPAPSPEGAGERDGPGA